MYIFSVLLGTIIVVMANVRDLKLDVKQMVKHFIQECYIHLTYSPPLHQEDVLDIISEAIVLEQDVVKSINHPPSSAIQNKKKYFRQVSSDFYDKIIELTERLNSLS